MSAKRLYKQIWIIAMHCSISWPSVEQMYLEINWRVNASSWTSWVRCGWGQEAGRRRPCPGRTSPAPGSPAPIRGGHCGHVTWCAAVIGHLEHVAEAQPTELGRHRGRGVAGHQVGGGAVSPHLHLEMFIWFVCLLRKWLESPFLSPYSARS